jgi:hypothetical protein
MSAHMVNNELKNHTSGYRVKISRRAEGTKHVPNSVFVEIADEDVELPYISVHFINNTIYSVSFLNSQFFEVPEETLWDVVDCLLKGSYSVHRTFFKRTPFVKAIARKREVLPERVYSGGFKDEYAHLPRAFSSTLN